MTTIPQDVSDRVSWLEGSAARGDAMLQHMATLADRVHDEMIGMRADMREIWTELGAERRAGIWSTAAIVAAILIAALSISFSVAFAV